MDHKQKLTSRNPAPTPRDLGMINPFKQFEDTFDHDDSWTAPKIESDPLNDIKHLPLLIGKENAENEDFGDYKSIIASDPRLQKQLQRLKKMDLEDA